MSRDRVKGLFTSHRSGDRDVWALDAGGHRRDTGGMAQTDYDIIIAGAGLAGATFALAAAQGGLKPVLVDPQPFDAQLAPTFDGRSTAIAYSTFRLLEVLVCPVTRGRLTYDRERNELISAGAKLAFPIRDGVPIMLAEDARPLD